MKWRIYLFMAGASSLFAIPACWRSANPVSQAHNTIVEKVGAVAGWNPLTLYLVAGLAVILVGVATFAFGGKATGAVLIACGAGVAYFGQTLILYPWLSLVAILAAGGTAAFIAYDRYKVRKKLQGAEGELDDFGRATEFLAKTIETVPGGADVKAGLRDLGPDAVNAVKKVIGPIKEAMRTCTSEDILKTPSTES